MSARRLRGSSAADSSSIQDQRGVQRQDARDGRELLLTAGKPGTPADRRSAPCGRRPAHAGCGRRLPRADSRNSRRQRLHRPARWAKAGCRNPGRCTRLFGVFPPNFCVPSADRPRSVPRFIGRMPTRIFSSVDLPTPLQPTSPTPRPARRKSQHVSTFSPGSPPSLPEGEVFAILKLVS